MNRRRGRSSGRSVLSKRRTRSRPTGERLPRGRWVCSLLPTPNFPSKKYPIDTQLFGTTEEASEKAYTSEILTCEGLIGFFDPSSAEAARKAKLVAEPRALAAQSTRAVETTQLDKGTKLVKKEEDYFIGGGGKKKGKKGRKDAVSPGPEAASEAPSSSGKFNLNVGILEELAKIDVDTPMGKEDVPKTLEKLREKLAWYKEHQEIKTKEVSDITSSPN